jgi:pyruvate/2-oxoglutarate dehydrogenase complex dihydrolipoamide dehydrogenase (E3) component
LAPAGARTLLVERDRIGGDCLWTGCVPSKALLTVAERAHAARSAAALGVHTGEVAVDFAAAMAHVKQAIATIAPHDSPERLRGEGVEVVHGTGRFVAPDRLGIDGRVVRFRHALIATGASPLVPPIPKLREAAPLTSDTLWDLTELPGRLVVLGGGPIGAELGQAFARLEGHGGRDGGGTATPRGTRCLRAGGRVPGRRRRTSNPRIYAGGDVTMLLRFTHTASTHGSTVVQNALFGLRRSVDHERIPWVTFTAPEVARVGLSAAEARERFGDRARVRTASRVRLDRAVASGETGGFATLIGDPKGRIVGATVVGPRAGETIGEVVAWMAGGAKLSTIVRSVHAYPTWSEDLTAPRSRTCRRRSLACAR